MEDWQKKLEELEKAMDREPTGAELDEGLTATPEPKADGSDTRVLRWTIIGVGAGLGLAVAYYILKPLVILLLLGGIGYGAYKLLASKD